MHHDHDDTEYTDYEGPPEEVEKAYWEEYWEGRLERRRPSVEGRG